MTGVQTCALPIFCRMLAYCIAFVMSATEGGLDDAFGTLIIAIAFSLNGGKGIARGIFESAMKW